MLYGAGKLRNRAAPRDIVSGSPQNLSWERMRATKKGMSFFVVCQGRQQQQSGSSQEMRSVARKASPSLVPHSFRANLAASVLRSFFLSLG